MIFTAIASGAFIGAILGLIGAGGAMVSVPILLYLFDFSPLHATTAALAVVFLAAFAGVFPKFKSKDVLIKEAITIWALGLVTNIGLGLIVTKIPDLVILIGFSLVLIGAGYSMLRAPISVRPEKKMPVWALILLSLLIIALHCLTALLAKYAIWSEINWSYPLIIAICALIIAWISSHLAPRTPTVHLKRGFAFLLFAIAAFTIITELFI